MDSLDGACDTIIGQVRLGKRLANPLFTRFIWGECNTTMC
jgi:hypothetical protein